MIFRKKEEPVQEPEPVIKKTRISKKEKEDDNFEWDKRRLIYGIIAIVAILVITVEVKGKFFPNVSVLGDSVQRKAVTSVEKPKVKPPNINLQSQVGSKISEIKEAINGLDAKEVASSSPQIQKLIKDMEGLKDLPSNEAKDACMKICGGI